MPSTLAVGAVEMRKSTVPCTAEAARSWSGSSWIARSIRVMVRWLGGGKMVGVLLDRRPIRIWMPETSKLLSTTVGYQ